MPDRPETTDQERWDAKYARDPEWCAPRVPDPAMLRALDRLAPGGGALARLGPGEGALARLAPGGGALAGLAPGARALDLAGGSGRHALELARRGFETHLWDVSAVGLELARAEARRAGLAIATRRIDLLLERPLETAEPFDLALVCDFRDRELVAELPRLLRPGGHLVFAHYTTDWPGEKPPRRFRLEPGELAAGLPGLETLHHEELGGRACLLARLRG